MNVQEGKKVSREIVLKALNNAGVKINTRTLHRWIENGLFLKLNYEKPQQKGKQAYFKIPNSVTEEQFLKESVLFNKFIYNLYESKNRKERNYNWIKYLIKNQYDDPSQYQKTFDEILNLKDKSAKDVRLLFEALLAAHFLGWIFTPEQKQKIEEYLREIGERIKEYEEIKKLKNIIDLYASVDGELKDTKFDSEGNIVEKNKN